MQHRRKGRILKREKGQREALLRGLMRSVILSKKITTTEARAKELRPRLEKLVTKERVGTLAAHREVVSLVGKDAATAMKKNILPLVGARTGGYTRITKLSVRKSDSSRMAQIGFVE